MTVAEIVRRSRLAQGLGEKVSDPVVYDVVVGILLDEGRTPPRLDAKRGPANGASPHTSAGQQSHRKRNPSVALPPSS